MQDDPAQSDGEEQEVAREVPNEYDDPIRRTRLAYALGDTKEASSKAGYTCLQTPFRSCGRLMPTIDIRHWITGKIIHSVSVDSPRPLFPVNLAGCDLSNADLRGADLCAANLERAILMGANLFEADLRRARLRGADLRYTNLDRADFVEADLSEVESYPCNVSKRTKFWGARIDAGSELETMQKEIVEIKRWKEFRRVNP